MPGAAAGASRLVTGVRLTPGRRAAAAALAGVLLGATWVGAARAGPAVPPDPPNVALYDGLATLAAPDDPIRAYSSPGGLAFLEGNRVGGSLTLVPGKLDDSSGFVHALAMVSGRGGEGRAFVLEYAGRPAAGGGQDVTVLSMAYRAGFRVAGAIGAGASVFYRRVRAWPSGPAARDDHYVGVDGGLLAGLPGGFVAGATLSGLEVHQVSPAGSAEDGQPAGLSLNLGAAYQPSPYTVVEADVVGLLNPRGPEARVEVRMYPGIPVGLRLGISQSLQGGGARVAWMAGVVAEAPGGQWAFGFTFLGGEPYGAMSQIGAVYVRM